MHLLSCIWIATSYPHIQKLSNISISANLLEHPIFNIISTNAGDLNVAIIALDVHYILGEVHTSYASATVGLTIGRCMYIVDFK